MLDSLQFSDVNFSWAFRAHTKNIGADNMRYRSVFLTILLTTLVLAMAFPVQANVETMTVSEILPGMRGIAKTVILGTEIREFDVEIIDVFRNLGFNGGPLIFCRISGDVVDETGGIAGGYSGSPVYIDGKLIGALSWGAYYTEGDIVGATPIHEMLRTFTYPDNEPVRIGSVPECLDRPMEIGDRTVDSVYLADYGDDLGHLQDVFGEETLIMQPCSTPLIVSGLSQTGFEMLKEFAGERLPYVDLVQGPGGGSTDGVPILLGPTMIEPGSSIGAQLATGDLDLTAVGTLTWVADDGRFLAFGHPFLADGETNLPFVTTEVIYTMPSDQRSFKMAEPLEIVGTITQDRLACVAGQLWEVPDMVNFHLVVTDHDIDRTRRFNYSIINKEDWLPMLGLMIPIQGLMYASDRSGPCTLKVNFTIYGEGLEKPITRENLVWGSYGSSAALNEFMQALNMLTTANPFREVKLTRVEIEVEITSARQTLDITRARYQNAPNIGPGAIGYEGPPDEDDKEAKDDTINDAALWLQQGPYPDDEMMLMDGMDMIDSYVTTFPSDLVKYHPGDTIEILVTLRPYREDTIDEVIKIEIPEDFPVGQTSVEITGGSSSSWYGGYFFDPYMGMGYDYFMPPDDLDESIEEFMTRDKNNSIVVRLVRIESEDPYYYLQDNYEKPEPIKTVLEMDDIIFGWYSLPVEIVAGDFEDENLLEDEFLDEELLYDEEYIEPDDSESSNPHRN